MSMILLEPAYKILHTTVKFKRRTILVNQTFREEQTDRSLVADELGLRSESYRRDELRLAFTRARTAENSAPAPPTSASTTVWFSGESVHPVCACSGTAIAAPIATPSITNIAFRITLLPSPYGRVPSVLFFTPTASGVTTGTAAPMNSLTVEFPLLVTHTSPEPSMARAMGVVLLMVELV